MSIQPTNNSIQTSTLPFNKYSEALPKIINNITRVALPAITLFAMANLSCASGGPLSYSACIVGCTALAPPAMPACFNLCLGFLFLPSP